MIKVTDTREFVLGDRFWAWVRPKNVLGFDVIQMTIFDNDTFEPLEERTHIDHERAVSCAVNIIRKMNKEMSNLIEYEVG